VHSKLPTVLKRLANESDRSSGPPHSNKIRHLSGRHVMLVGGCPCEWSSYPSRLTGGSMLTASELPLVSIDIIGNCGDQVDEFCGGAAIGADASFSRSPGDAMKHTGITGLSGRGAVFTEAGTTGVRIGSHRCLSPLPPLPPLPCFFLVPPDPFFDGSHFGAGWLPRHQWQRWRSAGLAGHLPLPWHCP
jgi:hypothetical protein